MTKTFNVERAWQVRCNQFARWMIVASAVALPLPTFWIGLTEGLFLLAWLAGGNYRAKLHAMWSNPIARTSLLLALLAIASMGWTSADIRSALENLGQYRELLLIPLMISILDDVRYVRNTLYGFIISLSFALFWSYLQWFGWAPTFRGTGDCAAFTGHIGFSTMLAFMVAACFWLASTNKAWQWVWITLGILAFINLFMVNTGRTGQVIFFILIPLVLFRLMRWRGLLMAAGVVLVLASAFYAISPNFKSRIQAAISDIHQYRASNSFTSLGLRLEFWNSSLALIREHPIVGGGTGSFAHEYALQAKQRGLTGDRVTPNPHNEYVLIWSQWGLIGFVMFVLLLWTQWRTATQLTPLDRHLGETIVLVMAIGCLFNSFLLDNLEGHFYAIMTVAIWSQLGEKRQTFEHLTTTQLGPDKIKNEAAS